MAKLKDIQKYLTELLQPALFTDYCTNGLQVEGKEEIKTICTAVSASLNAIKQAADRKADALFVHHGLFWARDSHDIIGITKDKLKSLIINDISLFGYHLPLDAHPSLGNNWGAAIALGWHDLQPFPAKDKQPIGVIGHFKERSFTQFCKELSRFYGVNVEAVPGGPKKVSSAALISGGAHKYIYDAACAKADCFITGSRDEPTWHQSFEWKINFAAVGHYASEVIGIRLLGEHLAKKFKLKCSFIQEVNPF